MFVIKGALGFDMMESHSLREVLPGQQRERHSGDIRRSMMSANTGMRVHWNLVPGFSLLLGPDLG